MTIIEQLSWRYATKKFDNNKLVTEQTLQILLEAFNLTATSYGLQPLKLVVIQDKVLQSQMLVDCMNQDQVAQAYHILVFCIETKIDKVFISKYFENVKQIRNTPDAILNPFKSFLIEDFSNKTQQEINNWATKQAYLVLGNLLTVCAIEGIDACPMEGFEPDKIDELLNLTEKNLKSVLLLPIGYRAEDDLFADLKKVRRPLSESIIRYKQ